MTKSELADEIGVSIQKLAQLTNKKFYKELKAVGYNKNESILSNIVVNEFYRLWGVRDKETI